MTASLDKVNNVVLTCFYSISIHTVNGVFKSMQKERFSTCDSFPKCTEISEFRQNWNDSLVLILVLKG